jgi:hypothetical protein
LFLLFSAWQDNFDKDSEAGSSGQSGGEKDG